MASRTCTDDILAGAGTIDWQQSTKTPFYYFCRNCRYNQINNNKVCYSLNIANGNKTNY